MRKSHMQELEPEEKPTQIRHAVTAERAHKITLTAAANISTFELRSVGVLGVPGARPACQRENQIPARANHGDLSRVSPGDFSTSSFTAWK